ncbi:MAG: methyl-accepting chemotaxis protein [Desulfobacterium sp.]|nr:methyl-accepting chemotaxis protein [Desulfobacterium sp.]
MKPKKKNHPIRKQYYINKSFQTRFIIYFFFILILGGAISIGLTLFNTQGTLTSSFIDSKLVIRNTSLAIMPSVIYTHLFTTAVVGIISIIVTLLFSHKIAGPMYRFEKDIDRISKGDLKNRVTIRQGDQLQGVETALNAMIHSLNMKLVSIKTDIETLAPKKDLPEDLHREIIRLKDKIDSAFTL